MLSVSSPFTAITFDEDGYWLIWLKLQHWVLFSIKCIQLLRAGAGTWRYTQCLDEKQLNLLFLCFFAKAISFLGGGKWDAALWQYSTLFYLHTTKIQAYKAFFSQLILKLPGESYIMLDPLFKVVLSFLPTHFYSFCTLNYFHFLWPGWLMFKPTSFKTPHCTQIRGNWCQ